jgi:hypothetical protein
MAPIPKRFQLDTRVDLPPTVWAPAQEAAEDAVMPHVLAWLSLYQGDIRKLAVACYLQGVFDAAQMSQEYPGWPNMAGPVLQEERR